MAGDWIPIKTHLSEEPEVLAIANETDRSKHEVMGLLVQFWGWVSGVSEDGRISSAICPHAMRALCAQVGADERFWRAVESVGWLDLSDGLTMPGFEKWLSRAGKRRIKEAERKSLSRVRNVLNAPGKCRQSARKVSACDADQRREEKRREDDDANASSSLVAAAAETVPTSADLATELVVHTWGFGWIKAREIVDRLGTTAEDVEAWKAFETERGSRLCRHFVKSFRNPKDIPQDKPPNGQLSQEDFVALCMKPDAPVEDPDAVD